MTRRNDATIRLLHGTDGRKMARTLLAAHDAARLVPSGAPVALKPNLVVARPASGGATTHPEIVAGAIEYLLDIGVAARDITIMEGAWVGDSTRRAFENCGYSVLARRYGVGLIDLKGDETRAVDTPAGKIQVCVHALETGFLLNLPVLKGHCQTVMTCALKNLKGCLPDSEKRRFHTMGLHRPIAALASVLRPALTLVDSLCGDPGFEEGGNPEVTNRMYIGEDPVSLDVFGCGLLGVAPEEVPYIGMAAALGVGSAGLQDGDVLEIGSDGKPIEAAGIRAGQPAAQRRHADWRTLHPGLRIEEDQACSACTASLAHAIEKLTREGADLSALPTLHIGQGFSGHTTIPGIGIGRCAGGTGCPPSAETVEALLRKGLA